MKSHLIPYKQLLNLENATFTRIEHEDAMVADVYRITKYEALDECAQDLPKELLDRCRDYFVTHSQLLNFVDGPCIIHRDYRPGNIIVHENKIQGIIDWSSARSGFAQEDFCAMEHGVWSQDSSSKECFLAGYARIRPVPEYSEIIPLLRMNKALATIAFCVKTNRQHCNIKLYQFNRQFLETFF